MYSTESQDDMVECPYNKVHRMARKRLQPHLVKCRLSYPNAELCKCPFNVSHLVPEPEFSHHVSTCPDKLLITQYKYNSAPVKPDEEDRKQDVVDCDENWDDTEAEAYDPNKYAAQANVIRYPGGQLPSERKEFRKNERKRLGDDFGEDEDGETRVKEEVNDSDNGPSNSKYRRENGQDNYDQRPHRDSYEELMRKHVKARYSDSRRYEKPSDSRRGQRPADSRRDQRPADSRYTEDVRRYESSNGWGNRGQFKANRKPHANSRRNDYF